jgi:CubicO group peptidase (beta-lactamase class C family)
MVLQPQRCRLGYAIDMIAPSKGPGSRVDELLRPYQGAVPGACVVVLRDGQTMFRRAYGLSDLEHGIAATPATNYRLASMSKQFTSAAILLLAEERRVALEAPICQWLPTLPHAAGVITIRQLLTHTSGLIDYEDLIDPAQSRALSDIDVLELLESENRTYFPPGAAFRYSNGGYALLALIAARAAGTDFASLLRARIFQPLKMLDTLAHEEGISTVAHRAYGYSAGPSWVRTDQSVTSAVLGDGGVYSSIDDLEKWDAALYDDRLLRVETLRLAFAPATKTDDPAVDYGFGWRISGESLWHSGETAGFRNVIVRFPKRRLTVIVLTNRDDPPPHSTALAIADCF